MKPASAPSTNLRIAASCLMISMASVLSASPEGRLEQTSFRASIVSSVMSLYGLNEHEAIERLDAEREAADVYRRIREGAVQGYAGSWFDAEKRSLVVAINTPVDFGMIEALGAYPVAVQWSLKELEAARARAQRVMAERIPGVVRSAYIDYPENRVIIGIQPGSLAEVTSMLRADAGKITLIETDMTSSFSAGTVRGADGIRNASWNDSPCTIAASVVGGFITAGHCGFEGTIINDDNETYLGTVLGSTFRPGVWGPKDAGWVGTTSGWTPQPLLNGYSDGVISVPPEWSGYQEFPVGTTVCRYGDATQGPHCGMINAKDQNVTLDGADMVGLTRVTGICSNDGDSGGPHISASSYQIQGINVGASPESNTCPTPATYVYFQPMQEALGLMDRTMLTAHGTAPPTIQGLSCESPGWSSFICFIGSYRSQGHTSLQWSSSHGGTGQNTHFSGACIGETWVTVTLTTGNAYGSNIYNTSFTCRSGPPL